MHSITKLSLLGIFTLATFSGCVNNMNILNLTPNSKEFNDKFRTACLERNGKVSWNFSSNRIFCVIKSKTINGNDDELEQLLAIPSELDNDGYNKEGYNIEGYDRNGFYKDGFDKDGFDKNGYNKKGFDKYGFDKYGFDKYGYNKDGFDKDSFDINKIHKITKTIFDTSGFDKNGFDKDGFNKEGYDRNGYNSRGLNKAGLTKQEVETKRYHEQMLELERQKLAIDRQRLKQEQDNEDSRVLQDTANYLNNVRSRQNAIYNNNNYIQPSQPVEEKKYNYIHQMGPNLYYVK